MLSRLHIKNYALIEQLDIEFHSGFSVITGETGAGKSIILGALGLLVGDRADSKAIKPGCSRCVVEATYSLEGFGLDKFFQENDLDFDGCECIIRRELSDSGKSRAFINDTPVSVATLKELGSSLLDIHSQHQNLLMNSKSFQLGVIDSLAGNQDELAAYRELYLQYSALRKERETLQERLNNQQENNDYLLFQLKELESAHLVAGEQEELEAEERILNNTGDIKESLFAANSLLQDDNHGAISSISDCVRQLSNLQNIFPKVSSLASRMESCCIELEDIQHDVEYLLDNLEFNPERQQFVNDRLNLLNSLENKYHEANVEGLIAKLENLHQQVCLTIDGGERLQELIEQESKLKEQTQSSALLLSQSRKEASAKVIESLSASLLNLGMPHVRFDIQFASQSEFTPMGIDDVCFLFSANKDMPLQELSTIASGGEMARVMLSLKALLASSTPMRTLIFDEIDTGVSGRIAEKMALAMKQISMHGNQVISITHLPQIAALGEAHYLVYKDDSSEGTHTHIRKLSTDERIDQIAHMLSGSEITEAARNNARELLK